MSKHYEYAAVVTVVDAEGEHSIVIPLSLDDEEVGKTLAKQYLERREPVPTNPERFVKDYRVVRRSVGEWVDWTGED